MAEQITVSALVQAPVEKAWRFYNEPEHIMQWAFGSPEWIAPKAESDLRAGGRFLTRMEAKDGSAGFDFTGTFTEVVPQERVAYTMDGDDRRKALITFAPEGEETRVTVTFDAETVNPIEMQKDGWQTMLDNYKKHVEET